MKRRISNSKVKSKTIRFLSLEQWKSNYLPTAFEEGKEEKLRQDPRRLGQVLASESIKHIMDSH